MIVAIDGPAGSGKSTVARVVADRLGFRYIETGSMYRAVAWKARQEDVTLEDLDAVAEVARRLSVEFQPGPDGQKVLVEGKDLTATLKTEEIGRLAALVAANPVVRDILVAQQRQMGKTGNIVMDGRDIGTVVFPAADKKFFMLADPVERARRRYDEMKGKVPDLTLEQVVEQVKQRDYEDENRAVSPLKPAPDAVMVDTTHMKIEDVADRLIRVIQPAPNVSTEQ